MQKHVLGRNEIQQARELLAGYLPVTRLVRAASLERASGAEVFLKLEGELPTGSFKVRGALHSLRRRREQGLRSVVTSSTGNHGAGVAYAARVLGVPATVFLPENPNPVKRARIAELGAHVVEAGRDLAASREHAARFAAEQGASLSTDVRELLMIPGTATIGAEILEQLPEVDFVFVPVGDSTLVRGVAAAVKLLSPRTRVVGVQAERAPAYYLSWKEGRAVSTDSCDTIADGLATRITDADNVRDVGELVDDMRLVSESELLRAVYRLLLDEHVVAEPAGAAATAALIKSGSAFAGKKVVLLVSGSNLTPELLRRAVTENPA